MEASPYQQAPAWSRPPGLNGPAPWCNLVEHPDGYVVQFGGGDSTALSERLRSLRGSIPAARRRWDPATRTWWIDSVVEVMFRSVSRWVFRSFSPDRVYRQSHAVLSAQRWASLTPGEAVEEGWVITSEPRPSSGAPPRIFWTSPAAARPTSSPTGQRAPLIPPAPIDPYAVLWLRPGAPWAVIKAAYRGLASIHHPDKGGDGTTMQQLNAAYAILRREAERLGDLRSSADSDQDEPG